LCKKESENLIGSSPVAGAEHLKSLRDTLKWLIDSQKDGQSQGDQ